MRSTLFLLPLTIGYACTGGTYQQTPKDEADTGADNGGDSGDSGDSGTGDSGDSGTGDSGDSGTGDSGDSGDSGTGDSGDSGTGDSGDSGTGDSGDSGSGDSGDSGSTDPALCHHDWNVLDGGAWSKEWDIVINNADAVGHSEGWGATYTTSGQRAWNMYDEITSSAGIGWAGEVRYACDVGSTDGIYMVEWDMTFGSGSTALAAVGTPTSPRLDLPEESLMGTIGTWSYSYSETISLSGIPMTINVSGTYTEMGTESIRLFDGSSYNAYHLHSTYRITQGTSTDNPGEIDQWYVRGLGLVREVNTNTNDGTTVLQRDLTGYSGLTPS